MNMKLSFPPLIHGLANDRLMACLITDGFHLPPDVIKVALRAKGLPSGIFLGTFRVPYSAGS